jgi:hypothetical protein
MLNGIANQKFKAPIQNYMSTANKKSKTNYGGIRVCFYYSVGIKQKLTEINTQLEKNTILNSPITIKKKRSKLWC